MPEFIAALTSGQIPWPFPWRPSLAVLSEPEFRAEVVQGLALLAFAGAVLVGAWRLRCVRLPLSLAALLIAGILALPHLDLLLVPAHPASYYRSPTQFAAASVMAGQAVYERHCVSCHGIDARGDGPGAAKAVLPPADLTADHLWDHSDGDMYWWVSRGMKAPDGREAMPGFADRLSPEERWAVIDYVRANAAGAEMVRSGRWPHEYPVPDMAGRCGDGRRMMLSRALKGAVHIVVRGSDGAVPAGPLPLWVVGEGARPERAEDCVVDDPAALPALAVSLQLKPEDLEGSQFLVSGEAWLLAHWFQGGAPAADSLPFEVETLRSICLSPQSGGASARHIHR